MNTTAVQYMINNLISHGYSLDTIASNTRIKKCILEDVQLNKVELSERLEDHLGYFFCACHRILQKRF